MEGTRSALNMTTGDIDNLARLESSIRELGEIADDLFLRRKGTKKAEREQYARRLNSVKAHLNTVLLNLGGTDGTDS